MKAVETPQQPLVGIVTVTFNSEQVLPDFIASLKDQTHQSFVLWAVDNDSKDNTVTQLQEWNDPRLILLQNKKNVGVAAANNQGIRAALDARCSYILILNNDVVFNPDLLAGLLSGLDQQGCELVVPLMYYANPADRVWCAGGKFRENFAWLPEHFGKNENDRGQFREAKPITYAPTCCTMVKRAVFERIGLMDERYFVYSDDVDFMYRAQEAKLVTYYLPEVKLWHKVSSLTGDESPFSQRYISRNRAFFIRKHLGRGTALFYTLLYRSYYLTRFLRRQDSWDTLLRKQKAWSEGLRIQ